MVHVSPWGFGMAPLSNNVHTKNLNAITHLNAFLNGREVPTEILLQSISQVKGLFNRVLRQDQWDWMTTAVYLGFPSCYECQKDASLLTNLRAGIKAQNSELIFSSKKMLIQFGVAHRFNLYRTYNPSIGRPGHFLYILSRRENPDILKIGMTTRDILIRIKEINSSTGMLFPLGARGVFPVTDARIAEKSVHQLLKAFRIRSDREFFYIPYKEACDKIEKHLSGSGLLV